MPGKRARPDLRGPRRSNAPWLPGASTIGWCEQDYVDLIAASPAVGFLAKATLSAGAIRDLIDGGGLDETGEPVSGPRGR
jgi:hypothetical protein